MLDHHSDNKAARKAGLIYTRGRGNNETQVEHIREMTQGDQSKEESKGRDNTKCQDSEWSRE